MPETSGVTLAVGAVALVLLLAMRRFVATWPRALIVVILGITVSAGLERSTHGVVIVAARPAAR